MPYVIRGLSREGLSRQEAGAARAHLEAAARDFGETRRETKPGAVLGPRRRRDRPGTGRPGFRYGRIVPESKTDPSGRTASNFISFALTVTLRIERCFVSTLTANGWGSGRGSAPEQSWT